MALCSTSSATANESLIGTSSDVHTFLLVEARFPWKHAILESKDTLELAPVLAHASIDGRPIKILLIAPDARYSREGFRRVLLMRRTSSAFVGEEYFFPREKESELLPFLYTQSDELAKYKGCAAQRTVVVCVDGGHDKCCGLLGQPLYRKLDEAYGDTVQVLQASHIGGHRFAPTCIDFPEGRTWGRIELDRVAEVFGKTTSFAEVSHMYRGSCLLPQRYQYVEKELLDEFGWGTPIRFSDDGDIISAEIDTADRRIERKYILRQSASVPAFGSCHDTEMTDFIKYRVEQV